MDFEQLITNLRDKLDDSTKGAVSEELLAIVGELRSQKQAIDDNNGIIDNLKKENEELLKTNGRLFQKIGFDKKESEEPKQEEEKVINIADIIDDKGNLI